LPPVEQLGSDATPAAVLDAFHRYRLNSVTNGDPQALPTTDAAARTRHVVKENDILPGKHGKFSKCF